MLGKSKHLPNDYQPPIKYLKWYFIYLSKTSGGIHSIQCFNLITYTDSSYDLYKVLVETESMTYILKKRNSEQTGYLNLLH